MELLLSLWSLLDLTFIAQVQLDTLRDQSITKIMIFAVIIAITGCIAAGFQLMSGNILNAIYVLLGSIIIGGAPAIARSFIIE